MTVIAQSLTVQRHVIRLLHSATRKPIRDVGLQPGSWPAAWSARVADGAIVLAGPDTGPSPEHIDVLITDGAVARVLDLPTPAADQPPDSLRVPLSTEEIELAVDPVAMELVVVVAGTPVPAATPVTVTAASGGAVEVLTKTDPGVYSATRVWGAAFINADLKVGATPVRKVSVDYTRAKTRIHVVNPT